jgi:signal transduction histidine kinase
MTGSSGTSAFGKTESNRQKRDALPGLEERAEQELRLARRAVQAAGVLGAISCSYGIVLAAPNGSFTTFEWVTVPIMGVFCAVMALAMGVCKAINVRRIGLVFSYWLAIHMVANTANGLWVHPEFGNAMIYTIWLPVTYLFAAAVIGLQSAMRLSALSILALVIAYAVTFAIRTVPPPGADHMFDALLVSVLVQPAVLSLMYGVGKYREIYAKAEARAAQWRENADTMQQAVQTARENLQKAEEANLAKNRFLATMSHELRTPLNAIIGFSELMKDNLLGRAIDEQYRDYAADIHETGQHLLHLINGILEISQREARISKLTREQLSLNEAANRVREILAVMATNSGLTLDLDLPERPLMVCADSHAVQQMLINLVGNAIKFTPEGGRVTIAARQRSGGGELTVRDTGAGIAADRLPSLFEPFSTSRDPYQASSEGAGLGLFITKSLAEMHGGTIDVRSAPGQGTEVVIFLPDSGLAPANQAEAHPHRDGIATPAAHNGNQETEGALSSPADPTALRASL